MADSKQAPQNTPDEIKKLQDLIAINLKVLVTESGINVYLNNERLANGRKGELIEVEWFSKEAVAKLQALITAARIEEVTNLKADWNKWLQFEDDDPNEPVPLKDIIAFFDDRIATLTNDKIGGEI